MRCIEFWECTKINRLLLLERTSSIVSSKLYLLMSVFCFGHETPFVSDFAHPLRQMFRPNPEHGQNMSQRFRKDVSAPLG